MVKAMSTQAIEAATGISWKDWCAHLDSEGAADLPHNGIVKKARAYRDISGWWAQGIAVAYEQHIGRRKPGEMSDGTFSASISRTVPLTHAQVHAKWCKFARPNLGGAAEAEPTISETPKRLYWRCAYIDGSRVTIGFEPKGDGKTRIGIEHKKLPSEHLIAEKKANWRAALSDCYPS